MRYGRLYVCSFENVAVAAQQDLFMVAPATNKPVVIHALNLFNVGIAADAGDAQEEDLAVSLRYGYTTVGSAGNTMTPVAINPADTAGFTTRINDTTVATTGTATTFGTKGWNTRVPFEWLLAPEHRQVVTAAQTRLVVRLISTPTDSFNVSGELPVEEIG